jgi:hypothetical protein
MDNHDIVTAVQYGDFRTVREYIDNRIYSPNSTDIDGCSLLHWSVFFLMHVLGHHLRLCIGLRSITELS